MTSGPGCLAGWLDRLILVVVGLCYAVVLAKTLGAPLDGDEPRYLLMTHSLVRDGDFDLSNNFARGDYRAFVPAMGYEMVRPFKGGASYALHYVGLPLLIAPGYALAGRAGATAALAAGSLLGVAGALRLARRWCPRGPAAPLAVAGLALSPPLLFHSSQVMPETAAAPLLTWGLLAILALPERGRGRAPAWIAGGAAIGAALAFLAWLHPKFLVAVAVMAAAALTGWPAHRRGPAGLAALALAIAASQAVMAALYWRWYDNPWPTGPRPTAPLGLAFVRDGLPGMLVDREYGLLVWAPLFGLALAGLAIALARGRPLAWPVAALFLAVWGLNAANDAWWAGTAIPPRYLIPVLPLLAGPLALALAGGRAPTRALAAVLAALGLAISLYGLLLPGMAHLRGQAVGQNALLERAGQSRLGRALLGGRDPNDALPSFVHGPLDWATAADLNGEIGRLVADPAAPAGQARAAEPGRDAPGYLSSGAPSWRFKGEVAATVWLRGQDGPAGRPLARIEAWRRDGSRLAWREVTGAELAPAQFRPVGLRFASRTTEPAELRVYWYGEGPLAADDVRVFAE